MTVIDKYGERQACDRCHRVRVKIRGTVCVDCRNIDKRTAAHAREMLDYAIATRRKVV